MSLQRFLAGTALSALSLAAAGAHAADTTSLAGWAVYGDALAQAGAITLTTAYLDGAADQAGNLSGHSAVDYFVLTNAAGLPGTALDLGGEEATEGSMLSQSFALQAGQSLRFSWSFGTSETTIGDHAFVLVNGQLTTLATSQAPGAASNSFSFTAASSGSYTLALGVVDTVDYNGVSTLRVSDLQLTSAVPEPGSWALLLAGMGLVGAVARGRRPGRAAVQPAL